MANSVKSAGRENVIVVDDRPRISAPLRSSDRGEGHGNHRRHFAMAQEAWVRCVDTYASAVATYQLGVPARRSDRRAVLAGLAQVAAIPAEHPEIGGAGETPKTGSERASVTRHSPRNGSHPLTARQQEVAALIARGYTNQQIAMELVLVPGTVANHVEHILRRLGADNRAQVAAWVARQGLLSDGDDAVGAFGAG